MGFFDDIGNFFESVFTPPGTNARRSQEDMIKGVMGGASDAYAALMPYVNQLIKLRGRYIPYQQGLVDRAIADNTDLARNARIDAYGRGAGEAAGRAASQAGMAAKAAGLGDGAALADVQAALGSGTDATNRFRAYEYSPSRQAEHSAALLQALGGLDYSGMLNSALSLGSLVNNQQPVHVGQGLGDLVGQLASTYVSSQTGGMFGGGGKAKGGGISSMPQTPGFGSGSWGTGGVGGGFGSGSMGSGGFGTFAMPRIDVQPAFRSQTGKAIKPMQWGGF